MIITCVVMALVKWSRNGVSNVFAKGVYPGTPAVGFLDGAAFPLSPTQSRCIHGRV